MDSGNQVRVADLRREEVAMLAGISAEYYTRLERGNASGASEDVLDGNARALQLDEAERAHLFDLVRSANRARPTRSRPSQERVRPTVQRILDAMVTVPAYVRNGRLDILAANPLYSPVFANATGTANMARFIFLNRAPPSSSTAGSRSPTTRWSSCAPKPAATLRPASLRPGRRAVNAK
jgi:transcriptional regulator with XRE-family HTH domain